MKDSESGRGKPGTQPPAPKLPCPWCSFAKAQGAEWQTWVLRGTNVNNLCDSSVLSSLKCLTISLKRKIYLVILISLGITFSFLELLKLSFKYQNDNHWSFKMLPMVTTQWWKRKKQGHRLPVTIFTRDGKFVLGGGYRELTKEKQNSSVSKHELKMTSFSVLPCDSRTQIQSGPGLRKCLWSRRAINMPSFKTTQSHTNIKQMGQFHKGYIGFWRLMLWVQ